MLARKVQSALKLHRMLLLCDDGKNSLRSRENNFATWSKDSVYFVIRICTRSLFQISDQKNKVIIIPTQWKIQSKSGERKTPDQWKPFHVLFNFWIEGEKCENIGERRALWWGRRHDGGVDESHNFSRFAPSANFPLRSFKACYAAYDNPIMFIFIYVILLSKLYLLNKNLHFSEVFACCRIVSFLSIPSGHVLFPSLVMAIQMNGRRWAKKNE